MNCYSVGRLAVRCVQEVAVERGQDSCVIGSGGAGVSARLFANCSVVKGFSSTEMNCFSAGVTVCVGRPDLFLFVVFLLFRLSDLGPFVQAVNIDRRSFNVVVRSEARGGDPGLNGD